MSGLGNDGQIGTHLFQHRSPPLIGTQHPQIGGIFRAVCGGQPQSGPQNRPANAGVGIPLGLGKVVYLIQGGPFPNGLIQPNRQPLPAVGELLKVCRRHGPQPGQYATLIVPQKSRVFHMKFPGADPLPHKGGGGILLMVSPVVGSPHPGNGDDLRLPAQP